MQLNNKAKLVLEDGTIFHGFSFAASKSTSGEVVFSTGMVGYPESLTDPSYRGQILCLTYPLIGNYGVPSQVNDKFGLKKHFESSKIHIKGLIVSDYSFEHSHWNAETSLAMWMKDNDIPGIFDIDTRELTKKLREKGTMLGKIIIEEDVKFTDPNEKDLVKEVTIKNPIVYDPIKNKNYYLESISKNKENKQIDKIKTVVLLDCGAKDNIIRNLLKRKLRVIRVPYDYDFLNLDLDGLMVSNGPGDPKMCKTTIKNIKRVIKKEIPIFGICLGNQLLALAAGADTYKLKYGHRSQNQPCVVEGTKRCYITTQNHGFAVNPKTLPSDWKPYFTNINDGTNEGIKHKSKPFFSSQFHPEAAPGPVDTEFMFDEFVKSLRK